MILLHTAVMPSLMRWVMAGDGRRVTAELASRGGCNGPNQSASECLHVASLETSELLTANP